MKVKNCLVILVVFILIGLKAKAQDPEFSQFYANPLYLNPAYAGSTECGRLGLNYRNQYPSLSNAYVTYNLSYDQNLPDINSGFGVLVMNDAQGDGGLVRTSASLFYSYNLQVTSEMFLRFGIRAGYYQEKLNWDKFIFASQINPTTGNIDPNSGESPPESNNISTVDFSTGIILSNLDEYFIGIAVDHLTQPNLTFYDNDDSKLPMKFTVNGGLVINATQGGLGYGRIDDILIQPNILYMQQDQFHQLNVGLYVNKHPIVVGAWFRHNFENPDAVVALIGLTFDNIKVGYSYDFTVSQVGGQAGGAHEISFSWSFCVYKEASRRHIKAIKSPSF